jgi:uncharacterized protein YqgC (DUF456 family)
MLRRIAVTIAGGILVALGLVGLFLPVLPGIVLIAAGLAVWSAHYAWAGRALEPLRRMRARASRATPEIAAADEE